MNLCPDCEIKMTLDIVLISEDDIHAVYSCEFCKCVHTDVFLANECACEEFRDIIQEILDNAKGDKIPF